MAGDEAISGWQGFGSCGPRGQARRWARGGGEREAWPWATPRASALEYRNDGIVRLLTRLRWREWSVNGGERLAPEAPLHPLPNRPFLETA